MLRHCEHDARLFSRQPQPAKPETDRPGRAGVPDKFKPITRFRKIQHCMPGNMRLRKRGFRSSAAVPLIDESGQSFAVLSLYSSWPGFFSAVTREAMLRHIQQSLSHGHPPLRADICGFRRFE